FVVQGYTQKNGIDFYSDNLFALVTKLSTVQLLLSWAASKNYEIHQIDVKSAYLYRELNEDELIYVKLLPGRLLTDIKPGQVLHLNKMLYRLKQAGRQWYKKITKLLLKIGLEQANYNHTVFYKKQNNKTILVTFMYINNIMIIGETIAIIIVFKHALRQHVAFTNSNKIH
ncbi:uncharacterized protein FOMMEDRAFT_100203, partial [Fomitiporia mediterranea MF3/22]